MLILNKNILTIGGNRLEGGPLTPPEPPGPGFRTVTIGTQTWSAENLAIDDGQGDIETKSVSYDGGQTYITEYFYNYTSAVRVASSIDGWHLPTYDEWYTFAFNTGGQNLAAYYNKSTYGWTSGNPGIDSYGFTILPSGIISNGSHKLVGTQTRFWTSTIKSDTNMYLMSFNAYDQSMITTNTSSQSSDNKYSIRLIKDT